MTAEEWQRVRELLEAALELPLEDRASFLDQACAAEPELRSQVDSLLACEDVESFLEDPPEGRMALSAGTRLGPYEILAPIGAGGMGACREVAVAK